MPKPVIFAAFANDHEGKHGGELRHIGTESEGIRNALVHSKARENCDFVESLDASLDSISEVFQDERYHGQIAIFHFGGHANGFGLLLQGVNGKPEMAGAGGLAAYLGRQRGLVLVFLNGCSTEPQQQMLIDAGVPCVIATSRAISDMAAAQFAIYFYNSLAKGSSITTAFANGTDLSACAAQDTPRNLYPAGIHGDAHADIWPWRSFIRKGSESSVQNWNLPSIAGNPLWGLPGVAIDIPDKPFRGIEGFHRQDARIFFGRKAEIRVLYDRITARDGDPIILYYGQSGVGKSSLLEAGVLPRLEQEQEVRYVRRNHEHGVLGTLQIDAMKGNCHDDMLSQWRSVEATSGRPLTIVLDQAEEAFTRASQEHPEDWDALVIELSKVFADSKARPAGRLILSFREEYLARFRAHLQNLQLSNPLPFAEVRLETLKRDGIIDAVMGIERDEALKSHFDLTVESILGERIANDLLAHPESTIAPILQILLNRMWEKEESDTDKADESETGEEHNRVLSEELYLKKQNDGVLLKDYLERQRAELRKLHPNACASGLALDLLAFHTTSLATAEQHTLASLRDEYSNNAESLAALLKACCDLQLLVTYCKPAEDGLDVVFYRLAHDTLAPLVRAEFEKSEDPGQRARRILQSRAVDWANGSVGDALDDNDLKTVKNGMSGMRRPTLDEKRLIAASEVEAEKRRRKAQQIRRGFVSSFIGLAVLLVLVGVFALISNIRQRQAEYEQRHALANQYAAQAQAILSSTNSSNQPALLDARDAVLATLLDDGYITVNADATLRRATDNIYWRMEIPRYRHHSTIVASAVSPTGEYLATASNDRTARLWEFDTGRFVRTLNGHSNELTSIQFSDDGSQLVTSSMDATVRVWNVVTGEEVIQFNGHTGSVRAALFSDDGTRVFSAGDDGVIRAWSVANGKEAREPLVFGAVVYGLASIPNSNRIVAVGDGESPVQIWDSTTGLLDFALMQGEAPVRAVAVDQSGTRLAVGSDDTNIRLWALKDGHLVSIIKGHDNRVLSVSFSRDGSRLVSAGEDKIVRLWDTSNFAQVLIYGKHNKDDCSVLSAVFSLDGDKVVSVGDNGRARIWDAHNGADLRVIGGHTGAILSIALSPTQPIVASGSKDKTLRLWSLETGEEVATMWGHDDNIESVAFSPDGRTIATGSEDRSIRIWDVAAQTTVAQWTAHEFDVRRVIYAPDGTWLASAADDGTIRTWNAETGAMLTSINAHNGSIRSLGVSPSGSLIASGGEDGFIRIWKADTAEVLNEINIGSRANDLAFGVDDSSIVVACEDGLVRMLNVNTGLLVRSFQGHSGAVRSVAINREGTQIASGGWDRRIWLWDVHAGIEVAVLSGHSDTVTSLAFSNDGNTLVSGSGGQGTGNYLLRVWNVHPLADRNSLHGTGVTMRSVAVSADGNRIAAGDDAGQIHMWNYESSELNPLPAPEAATDGTEPVLQVAHNGRVRAIAFSPDKALMATAGDDNLVWLWDAHSMEKVQLLDAHHGWVRSVSFSPDNKYVASAGEDWRVRVWQIGLDKPVFVLREHEDIVTSALFTADGKYIASTGFDGTVRIWNPLTGAEYRRMQLSSKYGNSLALSPDGRTLAVGTGDADDKNFVEIWDIDALKVLQIIPLTTPVRSVAFSPNGKWLAAAGGSTVKLWHAEDLTSDPFRELTGHTAPIWSIAFSSDSRSLITGSEDGSIRIWTVEIEELLDLANAVVQSDPAAFMPERRSNMLDFGIQGTSSRLVSQQIDSQ